MGGMDPQQGDSDDEDDGGKLDDLDKPEEI